MTTIPITEAANVIPSVISGGGTALQLNGLFLTPSTRVPIGTVASFPSFASAQAFFGAGATEFNLSPIYFNGYTGATAQPGAMLFAQYPSTAAAAYLQSGNTSTLTLAQLQALTGSLTVTMDGYARTASINLAGASSFSAAAALIQSGLNGAATTQATVTGSIGPQVASFNGSIAGQVLTVSSVTGGTIGIGGTLTGSGVLAGTLVTGQLSGTAAGGVGTYAVSLPQSIPAATAFTENYGLLNVTGVSSGTLAVGQTLAGTGAGMTAGTIITGLGTGAGLTGTYVVNNSQTFSSQTITGSPTPLVVTFDSVSGSFFLTSGVTGAASTAAFATGPLSASLLLTSATGAVLSQGSAPATPASFMNQLVTINTNWASFMLTWDPDLALSGGPQKLAFSAWNNGQNSRYVFNCWDADPLPATTLPATTALGNLINNVFGYGGTSLIYDTTPNTAAFACGIAASLNFNALNGRTTFKFRAQPGLLATVSTLTAERNLGGNPQQVGSKGNGYNFYGVFGPANAQFTYFANGFISGPYNWMDSYFNQIWLNSQLQLAMVQYMTSVNSIPYNTAGSAAIEAALLPTIQQGLNFGAFRAGVTLSAAQISAVNNAAGANIAPTLSNQGWYLQVLPASTAVRQARASPPCNFWYMDGQSVQSLTLNSILVQ